MINRVYFKKMTGKNENSERLERVSEEEWANIANTFRE
jgi:hypothetical protein